MSTLDPASNPARARTGALDPQSKAGRVLP